MFVVMDCDVDSLTEILLGEVESDGRNLLALIQLDVFQPLLPL